MLKLIAVQPLEGCEKWVHKCLKIGQIYYLCNDYMITDDFISLRDEYVRELPGDFFSIEPHEKLQINVAAIAGMNGDGKSSIIELIIRLINNCAKHYRLNYKEQLLRVEGVKALLYYELDGVVYCIREGKEDNYTSLLKIADMSDRKIRVWPIKIEAVKSVSKFNELFYTIVSNYSHYAYNTNDFSEEWKKDLVTDNNQKKCWLYYVFHKNDGYLTPLTLHPYRNEGNIDINTESELTMQRLMALYVQEKNPIENERSFRRIGKKDANVLKLTDYGSSKLQEQTLVAYLKQSISKSAFTGIIKKINDNIEKYDEAAVETINENALEAIEKSLDFLTGQNDENYQIYLNEALSWLKLKKGRLFSSKSDVRQLLQTLYLFEENCERKFHYENFRKKYKKYDKLNVMQLARLRNVYCVMQKWEYPVEILWKDYVELSEYEKCRHYIVYKTIEILTTYPVYKDILEEKNGGWSNNGLLFGDDSIASIVDDIRGDKSHVTLKLQQCIKFMEEIQDFGYNVYQQMDNLKLHGDIAAGEQDCLLIEFDTIKDFFKVDPFPLELLPPPIYNAEILYQTPENIHEFAAYKYLSSGEKQLLSNIGAIIYHIRNLDSVVRGYENVNIFLEEIELYFHPEYQRKIVMLFLDKLYGLELKRVRRINITFTTHSPFILSDIPLCNVLFLKEGKPCYEAMQENTFGANIHSMLRNGFFLPSLPIGEFAHEKINMLFERLNGFKLNRDKMEDKEWFYSNIIRVGEPYLREQLMKLFNIYYPPMRYD